MIVPLYSDHKKALHSSHYALITSQPPKPAAISWDLMANQREWPGVTPIWDGQHRAPGPYITVAERQTFRQRFLAGTFGITSGNTSTRGPGYSSSWALGAGGLPVNTGMPAIIDVDYPGHYEGSIGSGLPEMFIQATGTAYGPNVGPTVLTTGGYTTSASQTGWYLWSPTADPEDTLNVGLSSSSPFATALAVLTSRLTGRTFGTFPSYPAGEYFGEYSGWSSLTPPALRPPMDGAWHSGIFAAPGIYFGANPGGEMLWTGWAWPTYEENGSFADASYFTQIYGQRARFSSTTAVPYFIITANILRVQGVPGGVADGPDSVKVVTVQASGTTVPGTVYEVPWPSGYGVPGISDFCTCTYPISGYQTLSCGMCNFAIVGETISHWVTRTGV